MRRCVPDWCSGSTALARALGLMAMLVVLGVMSVTWMAVIAIVVVAQKILPARATIDVPLALAIVGLGIVGPRCPRGGPWARAHHRSHADDVREETTDD